MKFFPTTFHCSNGSNPSSLITSHHFRKEEKNIQTKKVAFVTYNHIGRQRTISDGWNESNGFQVFVLQDTKGRKYEDGPMNENNDRINSITSQWIELEKVLPELDYLVIYLGTGGSEKAIELAAKNVAAEKVIFVGCDCNLSYKEIMIQRAGLQNCGRILCECGGHDTMKALYAAFMEKGLAAFGQLVAA